MAINHTTANVPDLDLFVQKRQYTKRLLKKLEGKPLPVKIIQRRTLNTAFAVLNELRDIPFEKLSMSLYFYCESIEMREFTRKFEAQLELAGANPDKFILNLHKFFNDIASEIKKKNLYIYMQTSSNFITDAML